MSLRPKKILIMGDFNKENINTSSELKKLLRKKGLTLQNKHTPTTQGGTGLDSHNFKFQCKCKSWHITGYAVHTDFII